MPSKVLFVTNKVSPDTNPEAIISSTIAKYLSMYCEVHLVTTTVSPSGIGASKCHVVPWKDYHPFNAWREGIYAKLGKNARLNFPDSHAGWVDGAAIVAEELVRKEGIRVVITRSMPASTHMVGLRLKMAHQEIKWIASLSDPMYTNQYVDCMPEGVRKRLAEYEKEIIEKADAVTHTNRFALERYCREYPGSASKHDILPNMFDRERVEPSRTVKIASGPMVLSYAGRFYGRRNPESLFKAVRQFAEKAGEGSIKVNIIGAGKSRRLDGLVGKYGLASIVEQVRFMGKDELATKLASSHLLVTIDGDFPGENVFSPSKNYDYLSMTVPMLAITRKGATASLIDETKSGYWAEPEDTAGILGILTRHAEAAKNGCAFEPDHGRVMAYHAKNVVRDFHDRHIAQP